MVKNRAPKLAARAVASQEGTRYTSALAKHPSAQPPLRLELGLDTYGRRVSWPGRSGTQYSLAIQGTSGSGKTTILDSLAKQAVGQAEVYICSSLGKLAVPGATRHADGNDSSVDLIRTLLNDVRATIAEARAFFEASLPAKERRSSFVALQRTDALVAALPTAQHPPRQVLIIDDYDLLCRNWEWKPVMSARVTYSPEALVQALVDHASQVVDMRVILAGESFAATTLTYPPGVAPSSYSVPPRWPNGSRF